MSAQSELISAASRCAAAIRSFKERQNIGAVAGIVSDSGTVQIGKSYYDAITGIDVHLYPGQKVYCQFINKFQVVIVGA